MNSEDTRFLTSFLTASQHALRDFSGAQTISKSMIQFTDVLQQSFAQGGKLMIVGNGGSAGDAQHIACEFVTRLGFERAPLPCIALASDSAVLTAAGNDYGFEYVFERQVRAIGRKGDVLLGISTSGKSLNILKALSMARSMKIITLGFAGPDLCPMDELCDVTLHPPAPRNYLVQQLHLTAAHAICGMLEQRLYGPKISAQEL